MMKVSQIVEKLNLKPHPDGGFYNETFRDNSVTLSKSHLPSQCLRTSDLLLPRNTPVFRIDCKNDSKLLELHHWEDKVDRAVSTAIYFLLPSGSVAHLHRIPCAETFHYYLGEPIMVMELNEDDGQVKLTRVGPNLVENEQPQYTVPPYVWFGSFPAKDITMSSNGSKIEVTPRDVENHYCLLGVTCAPGFQYEDSELAKRSELVAKFPKFESLISLLTIPD